MYDSEQDTVSIGLNWFSGNRHETRLKSQFVALQADNPQSLISDNGGYLYDSDDLIKPFTQGVVSFQVRYKYEIAPLSYLYLVYSKGGTSYDEDEEYHYNVQTGENFVAWMKKSRTTKAGRMMFKGREIKVDPGFSEMKRFPKESKYLPKIAAVPKIR